MRHAHAPYTAHADHHFESESGQQSAGSPFDHFGTQVSLLHIAIDESGSFVHTDAANSWNCVLAYVYPETQRRLVQKEVMSLRGRFARPGAGEVKLRDIDEESYIRFLQRLVRLEGICFSVATDAQINTPALIQVHQAIQVEKILENVDRMIHQSGRDSLVALAERVGLLPRQLYVQMVCQVELVDQVIRHAALYFVQRRPVTLGHFRWRVDQKNSTITEYENAYSQVLSPFMQSRSIRDPIIHVIGGDYSAFDRFRFPPGEEPTYLEDHYGIVMEDGRNRSLNIGQILREDLEFVNSRAHVGVQVADLVASGLRRCLRAQFEDNDAVAALLGRLMVRPPENNVPVRLVCLGEVDRVIQDPQESLLRLMRDNARHMLTS